MTLQELRGLKYPRCVAFLGLATSLATPALYNQSNKGEAHPHPLPIGAQFSPLLVSSTSTTSVTVGMLHVTDLGIITELGNPQGDETIKLPPPSPVVAGDVV
jgi:hypothetical protein